MNKASFGSLLYREFYIGKSNLKSNIISIFLVFAVAWILVLGIKFGNLKLVFEGLDVSKAGVKPILRLVTVMMIKYMPALMAGLPMMIISDVAAKDSITSWERFMHCTPVTPQKYAAVKFTFAAVLSVLCYALAAVHILIICPVMGEKASSTDIGIVLIMVSFLVFLPNFSQIFISLVGNKDKGMLISFLIVFIPANIIGFLSKNSDKNSEPIDLDMEEINRMLASFAKYRLPALLIAAASLVLVYVGNYLIYKRREK